MRYRILVSKEAQKEMKKLEGKVSKRIIDYLGRVILQNNPFDNATYIVGSKRKLFRYRVGTYRVICTLGENDEFLIVVVRVGHRKDIYEKLQYKST